MRPTLLVFQFLFIQVYLTENNRIKLLNMIEGAYSHYFTVKIWGLHLLDGLTGYISHPQILLLATSLPWNSVREHLLGTKNTGIGLLETVFSY